MTPKITAKVTDRISFEGISKSAQNEAARMTKQFRKALPMARLGNNPVLAGLILTNLFGDSSPDMIRVWKDRLIVKEDESPETAT